MKSASEWLASSSDDEPEKAKKPTPQKPATTIRRKSRSPSPTTQQLTIPHSDSPVARSKETAAAARQREAEERRKKQEELRERMKATLGETVAGAITETSHAPKRTVANSDDSNSLNSSTAMFSMPAGQHQNNAASSTSANLPPVVPSTRGSGDFGKPQRRNSLEEIEVMLADRGTQTLENVECQTDPEPRVLHCARCYADYYGHIPDSFGCPHEPPRGGGGGGGNRGSDDGFSRDPIFAALLQRHAAGSVPYLQTAAYGARGGAGGSAGGILSAVQTTSLLREQLNCVQSSIDMLISRYNLPPPPGMEHLAVGGTRRSF